MVEICRRQRQIRAPPKKQILINSTYWKIAPKVIRVGEARPREDQPEHSGTERNLPGDIDGGRRRAEIRVAAHQRLQAEQEIRRRRPCCDRKAVPGRPALARGPRHD
jgi:hypothetical protein